MANVSYQTALVVAGAAFLAVGIFGFPRETKWFTPPSVSGWQRVSALIVGMVLLTVFFVWVIPPPLKNTKETTQKDVNDVSGASPSGPSTLPSNPAPPDSKTEAHPQSRPKHLLNSAPVIIKAPVTQEINGPCGINNIGGTVSGNTCVTTPPDRILSAESLQKFFDGLSNSTSKGTAAVIPASTSDDVEQVKNQIIEVLHRSHWGYSTVGEMWSGGIKPTANGIECYSENWSVGPPLYFKQAADAAHFSCKYISGRYSINGVSFGGEIQILIGKK